MAKLKDRTLYKKGILKLQGGGMVPQSPFTAQGLNQAGISALNTIKNPATYTQFAKKLPMRTLGVMGLTNPYTLPFAGPMVAYSIADTLTPQSVKDRAELKRQVDGEYQGIQDYMDVPERESTVDLLKRAQNMNIQSPLTKRLNAEFGIKAKVDDRETGPEVIDKGGSDMQVKKPVDISNRDPEDNNQQAQQLVNDQKKTIKNAEKVFNEMESKARGQGKMTNLNNAIEAAREVMGEQGYGKSGRLLLLQLASNLLAGKTMQPGAQGFLDVLGQAGQNVIPMAIALEREREKEELGLAKVLLESGKKTGKVKPPSIKVRYRLPNGEISDPVPASTTDTGQYLVYDQLPDGQSVRYLVDPGQVVGQAPIADNVTNKAKLLNEYKAVKSGQLYTDLFIKVASENPDLIGPQGGWKKMTLKAGELLKIATGSETYKDTILKLADREQQNFQNFKQYGEVEEGVEKRLNGIFSKIEEKAADLDSASEEIQAQALLETLELLSTYSLAQTLKDKDRLAVADIQRAEKRLGGTVGYIPFYDNNPLEIITAYKTVNDKFKNRLGGIRNQWKDIYYYNPMELDAIDKDFATQMLDKNQENINKFVEGYTPDNNQDTQLFEQMFNKDNLQGIIKQQ
jgi:hypothetical protein